MRTLPVEVHYFMKPSRKTKQDERGQTWPEVVWQSESSPEVFLREVVDTLAGFLRDDAGTRAAKTGETPSEG
jgi:hypothetical protein